MFDQFDSAGGGGESRKRMGASVVVSIVVYGLLATVGVAVSATVGTVVQRENLRQVVFTPPPPPAQAAPAPEPPPPPKRVRTKRVGKRAPVDRKEMVAPDAIPDTVPEEADGPLVEGEPAGPVDGFLDGGRDEPPPPRLEPPPPTERPRPPVQHVERVAPPVPSPNNPSPEYPELARRTGIQGLVVANIIVETTGRVARVEILRGPAVFHDTVRRALLRWRFRPARFEGRNIRIHRVVRIPFRLENAKRV